MKEAARWVATVAILASMLGLLVVAWSGYRSAAWLLLIDALPLCG